jgi:UDP-glucose 4-epimerase
VQHSYSKILVTGGAGFIGSHVVDRLLRDGFEVMVLDNLSSGKLENVSYHDGIKNFNFMRGDIRKLDLVKKAVKEADAVFHEAAVLTWTGSRKSLLRLNQVNVNGTLTLLNACADSDVEQFLYASSVAVYGEAGVQPQHEDLSLKRFLRTVFPSCQRSNTSKCSIGHMGLKQSAYATLTFMVHGKHMVPTAG